MKRFMSFFLILIIVLGVSATSAFAGFDRDFSFEEELAVDLKALGLFKGVSDTNFALHREPTRIEALVMLIRVLGKEAEVLNCNSYHPFTDVPAWADKYVGYAYKNGLTKGVSVTKFGNENASSAMYITFMLRALGYSDANGEDFTWDSPYILAEKVGILPTFVDISRFLRADVVTVSYAALSAKIKNSETTLELLLKDSGVFDSASFTKHYDMDAIGKKESELTSKTSVSNYEINEGELLDALNDVSAWKTATTKEGSSILQSSETARCGSSMSFSFATAGTTLTAYKSVSYDFSDKKKTFSFWVYIPEYYKDVSITLSLNSGKSYYASSTRAKAVTFTNTMFPGWQKVIFSENNFSAGGNFDWSDVRYISLQCTTPSKVSDVQIYINDLRIGAEYIPKIIFRFDDGLKGVYRNAFPALEKRDMTGIVYINSLFTQRASESQNLLMDGTSKKYYKDVYCTTEELMEMYDNGFDVGNHSRNHVPFSPETTPNIHYGYEHVYTSGFSGNVNEELRTSVLYQIKMCQEWLEKKGFVRSEKFFAVPGGHNTDLCQKALKECGVLTSTNSVHNDFVPTNDLHNITAWGISRTTGVEQIQKWISRAVARGSTVVLMFHDIVDEYNDNTDKRYQYLTSDFELILDWIAEQGWSEYVVSMSEWYEGLNR